MQAQASSRASGSATIRRTESSFGDFAKFPPAKKSASAKANRRVTRVFMKSLEGRSFQGGVRRFRGEDANGVVRGVEHVVAFGVGTHFNGDAHAIAFGVRHDGDDFLEFAVGAEAFDAGGRTGFGGENVAVGEHAEALG